MVSLRVLGETSTESFVFSIFLLRFRGGLPERELEYSAVFIVSNTHNIFWAKVGCVMIIDTFRASAVEPFVLFGVLLGRLLEVLFFTTFEGNRVTAGSSG